MNAGSEGAPFWGEGDKNLKCHERCRMPTVWSF